MLLAILDTETNGLDPTEHEVIEIAIQILDTSSNTVVRGFSAVVCPVRLPDGCEDNPALLNPVSDINHIDPLALLSELSVDADLTEAVRLLEQVDAILAHNAPFDRAFIDATFQARGLEPPAASWVCTNADITYPNQAASRKLTHLASDHGLSTVGAHRALADVMMLTELLRRVDNLEEQVREALLPREVYILDPSRSYEFKDSAKKIGFQWIPENKVWQKALTEEKAQQLLADGLPIILKL